MSHQRSERHSSSRVEQDERAVTKWLNNMEASLANPRTQFSITDFSPREIRAINSYVDRHQRSLGRYEQFLPPMQIEDSRRRPSC
jgi:hypothetical protein